MLFEGTIEPFECASTSPITAEKGKAKKLKVVRSKNPKKKIDYMLCYCSSVMDL